MTVPSGYRLVDIHKDRVVELLDVDSWAFAFSLRDSDIAPVAESFQWDRARGVEIADANRGTLGQIVATRTSFPWQMRLPGGPALKTSGLTWVGVHQGHRRRGLLSAMIGEHFARSLARGEAVSTLFAAETEIYQRFGYGLASHDLRMTLGRGTKLRPLAGAEALHVELDTADRERHGQVLADFQRTLMRPGTNLNLEPILRPLFEDPIEARDGAEPQRVAIVRDGGTVVAYALFRRKLDWGDSGPDGKTRIAVYAAATAAASHRLWSVLTDLDLMTKTEAWLMPVDDPLLHQLSDMRGVQAKLKDGVWVRILDIKAALEARGYAADADLVIQVTDGRLPANGGLWRVAISGGEAAVSRSDAAQPDLSLAVQELGAAYLGGMSLVAMLRAGLIEEHTEGAASVLSRAMLSDMAPTSNFMF